MGGRRNRLVAMVNCGQRASEWPDAASATRFGRMCGHMIAELAVAVAMALPNLSPATADKGLLPKPATAPPIHIIYRALSFPFHKSTPSVEDVSFLYSVGPSVFPYPICSTVSVFLRKENVSPR